ncbi:electron transfer flavoprotein subunit alpha/FixB family protein [Candidatus Sulfidibacterium hydrothermale]|uniref:electron transfer flavoprotein subunit alpha/FixB family protein n=1 Tax=Candidatus Sulfidibacterium hydrothermale TaxID=2875962 RepID=UPI001F0A1F58|nr:electron transfer flavoprotein subunit alpha/FixB family protein [Candidatus Sulfidibacterium hydrothermale]UBM61670.1 electron transfer flavoprotein subunit alpha/FixB family protein [Candidatus Sulfidibacterium hydrothermale]
MENKKDTSGRETEKAQYKDVWVFVEQTDGVAQPVSFELLTKARELAGKIGCEVAAVSIGKSVSHLADEVFKYGADKFYVIENDVFESYRTEPFRDALSDLVRKYKPEIFLIGATTQGRDLSGTVATELKTGLTADTTKQEIDPETGLLLMTRPTFGGSLMATIICPDHRPQMSTVRPGVFKAEPLDKPKQGKIIREETKITEEQVVKKILQKVVSSDNVVNLGFYDVIVAGGKGMGNKDNFEMLIELADLLGGTWAGSRKAVELGFVPQTRQVGQTGQTVHPKLYIACGISGAIQHLVGMQTSDTIISINIDENAPIFDVSTYCIVEDALKFVPRLIAELRTKTKTVKK